MKFDRICKLLEDELNGGLADEYTVEDIAAKHGVSVKEIEEQLEMGIEVEMEHTDDEDISREIAMDHLVESPTYYTRLADMEADFEKD